VVWVQTFAIDQDEVTHAEYQACARAGKCPKAGPNYKDYDRPRQPIVGVSWYDAVDYCERHGKRLPSEAEWEKAARGPDAETHPWGSQPATCERAVIMDERGRSCGTPKAFGHPEKGRTYEIGSRPAYRYGLRDMSGNSWEWVQDWASKSWAECGAACQGVDPKGPCGGSRSGCSKHYSKVVRGGSWYWPAEHASGFYRRFHFPKNQPFHHFGFRCAASVEQAKALAAKP
jgi:formylglycine-generating enzyme required for sulfatase activity